MQIEEVRIDEITLHPRNPKIHSDKQIKKIENSIKRFGWTADVILSSDNVCLAGHARIKAAINLGWETIPCKRTKLTGDEALAYMLADNELANAPYDRDLLAELLSELPKDLSDLTGFEPVQIESLISGEPVELDDIDQEWVDMPEFNQQNELGCLMIKVRFKTEHDRDEFARLVNQTITDKTRYIWYPKQEIDKNETQLECKSMR